MTQPDNSNDQEDTDQDDGGDIMAGDSDRRLAREDSALPDWHIPDATYRPIPIAWFAGAFLLQTIGLFIIIIATNSASGLVLFGLSAVLTWGIGHWTWKRGMREAGGGWKIATLAMLFIQFGLVALVAFQRI